MKQDRDWLPGATDLDWIESVSPPIAPALEAIEVAAAPLGSHLALAWCLWRTTASGT